MLGKLSINELYGSQIISMCTNHHCKKIKYPSMLHYYTIGRASHSITERDELYLHGKVRSNEKHFAILEHILCSFPYIFSSITLLSISLKYFITRLHHVN